MRKWKPGYTVYSLFLMSMHGQAAYETGSCLGSRIGWLERENSLKME